jgi:alpha-tubulin suppressor-like RCC1 family protein
MIMVDHALSRNLLSFLVSFLPTLWKLLTQIDIHAVSVTAGSDQSFAIDEEGRAYSWGFSSNYQTGQGTDDDVMEATLMENSAIKGQQILGALAGGQFGILYSYAA